MMFLRVIIRRQVDGRVQINILGNTWGRVKLRFNVIMYVFCCPRAISAIKKTFCKNKCY